MINKKFLFLFSVLFILLTVNVFAQNVVEDVLKSIAGENFDITNIYNKYGMFIDLVIYLVVFVGIAHAALMKRFKAAGGKAIVIGVGLALSIGLAVWGNQPAGCRDGGVCNLTLAQFGPFAGAVFTLLIFIAMWEIIKTFMSASTMPEKGKAALIAFVIVWYATRLVAPAVTNWVLGIPYFGGIISAVVGIGLILGIYWIFRKFFPGLGGLTSGAPSVGGAIGEAEKKKKEIAEEEATEVEEIKKERDIQKRLKDLEKRFDKIIKGKNTENAWKKVEKDIKKIYEDMKELEGLERMEYALEKLRLNQTSLAVLQDESNLLNAFNKVIGAIFNEVNKGGPLALRNAEYYANSARKIIKQIIKLNKQQKRKL